MYMFLAQRRHQHQHQDQLWLYVVVAVVRGGIDQTHPPILNPARFTVSLIVLAVTGGDATATTGPLRAP